MKTTQKQKFLVALDGSGWSRHTVSYLNRFMSCRDSEIHLFHVFSDIPECYRDLETAPANRARISQVQAWELAYQRDITEFMERSRSQLISAGFPEGNVSITIQKRQRGIARDIIDQAKKGYSALVAGKKGFGEIPETAFGSVAGKLVEKVVFTPLILTDIRQPTSRVLIAVDGSPGSDRAVEVAAEILGASGARFVLASVLRGYNASTGLPGQDQQHQNGTFVVEEVEASLVLDDAREILQEAGVGTADITQELILGAGSRARSLADMARQHQCDTLILGRKGWSNVEDFSLGRVAWKSLHAARDTSVWIVSSTDPAIETRR